MLLGPSVSIRKLFSLEEDRESTEEVGYRIGESVLIIRQNPPTDDPNPRITFKYKRLRDQKRLLEREVTYLTLSNCTKTGSGSAGS